VIIGTDEHGLSTIKDTGTYRELVKRGHDLHKLDKEHHDVDSGLRISEIVDTHETTCNPEEDEDCPPVHVQIEIAEGYILELQSNGTVDAGADQVAFLPVNETMKQKLASTDDQMSTEAVPLRTYVSYMKSVRNPYLIAAMLASYLMVNGAQFYQQYVVAKWTEVGSSAISSALGGTYLRSLARAALVVSTFLWLRSYFLMKVGVRASRRLHHNMLKSVIRAPLGFFDATPSGQLISRFGKELDTVDRALPDGIGSVLFCLLQIFSSSAALAGVVTPGMLVPLAVVGYFYVQTMSQFRPAARDLKRAESKSRSPIYTQFKEALRGTETIRSLSTGINTWAAQHRALTDQNLAVFFTVKALDRWLSIRLESLGNAVVFAAAVASIFLTKANKMKSGSAGWGLTQALAITGLMTWAVRCLTDLESQMMSLIRIEEITDMHSTEADFGENDKTSTITTEKARNDQIGRMPKENREAGSALDELPNDTPSSPHSDVALVRSGWPWKGHVRFNNISMRYNAISPLVLKNVDIDVPAGTTLGVVGRSGSGKSSLLLALFRLVEIEATEGGSIEIDGVDIRSVGLKTLRESLSIIPQDPVLFAGTVMYNLDATGNASEEEAWDALEKASPDLAKQFRSDKGLNTLLTEGGKNLSSGQRQLICLARALLRKSKILVLDEATSSVDAKTDAQVQSTIRREFVRKGVTVITVAHRLDTVLGYDKIAVLGNGRVIEYGAPQDLLKKRNGSFRRLVIDMKKKENEISLAPVPLPA